MDDSRRGYMNWALVLSDRRMISGWWALSLVSTRQDESNLYT